MVSKMIVAIGLAVTLGIAGMASAAATDAAKCSASIRKCCGKAFYKCTKCYAKQALKDPTDAQAFSSDCRADVRTKYEACTAKALAKGGCVADQTAVDHLEHEIFDDNEWCFDVFSDTPVVP